MRKAKLVKRAEITILGTVALALFCSAHVPDILSALDTATSMDPAVYSASAAAPYVENSTTMPAPVAATSAASVSDTVPAAPAASPETTISVSALDASSTEASPTEQ